MQSRQRELVFWLIGLIAFMAVAITLESRAGVPFVITYRVACAAMCLKLVYNLGTDYPGAQWPKIAFAVAALFNLALFFSPIAKFPASKGDIMFFAAPDAAIFLIARIATYPVSDVHQRAVRQQLIFGLVIALAVWAALMSLVVLTPPPVGK
ncbi:MAG: hypothetical protein JSS36_09460 [Proteobacteria bacterium]|nr:hypothetical protein [Pseudomonadota bacterium]